MMPNRNAPTGRIARLAAIVGVGETAAGLARDLEASPALGYRVLGFIMPPGPQPEQAVEQEWGRAPVYEREGGSIPVAALFNQILHAPVVLVGTGLPDDNVHAPNEKFNLENFFNGILASAFLYEEIAGTRG